MIEVGSATLGSHGMGRRAHLVQDPPPKRVLYYCPFLHPTVISRNILTHKDMMENQETPVAESRLRVPPGAKGANGSIRTLLEKMGGKTGPGGHVRTAVHADEM